MPKSEKFKAQLEQLKVFARNQAFTGNEEHAVEWARLYLSLLISDYAQAIQDERQASMNLSGDYQFVDEDGNPVDIRFPGAN